MVTRASEQCNGEALAKIRRLCNEKRDPPSTSPESMSVIWENAHVLQGLLDPLDNSLHNRAICGRAPQRGAPPSWFCESLRSPTTAIDPVGVPHPLSTLSAFHTRYRSCWCSMPAIDLALLHAHYWSWRCSAPVFTWSSSLSLKRYAAAITSTQPWRPSFARLTTRSLPSVIFHLPAE